MWGGSEGESLFGCLLNSAAGVCVRCRAIVETVKQIGCDGIRAEREEKKDKQRRVWRKEGMENEVGRSSSHGQMKTNGGAGGKLTFPELVQGKD